MQCVTAVANCSLLGELLCCVLEFGVATEASMCRATTVASCCLAALFNDSTASSEYTSSEYGPRPTSGGNKEGSGVVGVANDGCKLAAWRLL